jgi:hypothetical protein
LKKTEQGSEVKNGDYCESENLEMHVHQNCVDIQMWGAKLFWRLEESRLDREMPLAGSHDLGVSLV